MIYINVFFAETEREYDFKVDETARIQKVTEEMVAMIAEQEQEKFLAGNGLFMLCDAESKEILPPTSTLAMNGITSGRTLLLI